MFIELVVGGECSQVSVFSHQQSRSVSVIEIFRQSTEEDSGGAFEVNERSTDKVAKGDSGMRGFDRDTSSLHRSVLRNYFEHRAIVFRATHVGGAIKVASVV
jgi:hypothetical protein